MAPEEAPPAADDFNIPLEIFGLHSERFWGGLGRTVALAALLEDKLTTLLQAVTASPQDAFATKPGTEIIRLLGREGEGLEGWQEYLARCTTALQQRHGQAHSLWPAQAGNTDLFAHRRNRKGERVVETVTYEQVQQGIDELVSLVREWPRWFSLATSITRRRPHSS